MINSRDEALRLVEEGVVTADDMLMMALKYMSMDDVADMLDANELSERFLEEEEEEGSSQRTTSIGSRTARTWTFLALST